MQAIENYKLGETRELLELNTAEEHRELALAMAQQARRSILILTRDLDHPLYDTPEFEQATSELARGSQHARVRILVQDSGKAVKNGHRLVGLAQRISSRIEIRKPAEEYADVNHTFFVADQSGYISRQLADRYVGVANFDDRLSARNLVNFFTEIWDRSQQDPQLRRLHL